MAIVIIEKGPQKEMMDRIVLEVSKLLQTIDQDFDGKLTGLDRAQAVSSSMGNVAARCAALTIAGYTVASKVKNDRKEFIEFFTMQLDHHIENALNPKEKECQTKQTNKLSPNNNLN